MPKKNELKDKAEHKLNIVYGHYVRKEYDDVVENIGYVAEFGLKACVCKHLNVDDYPEERRYFTHNFDKLITLAGLESDFQEKKNDSIEFFTNYSLLSDWSVELRYEPIGSNSREYAGKILNAMTDNDEGVYPWIKTKW